MKTVIERPRPYTREELEKLSKEEIIDPFLKQQEILNALFDQSEKLAQQVRQNSQNSSRPPSSDGPKAVLKRKKKRRKKRGAQVGHDPHVRQLAPEDQVSKIFNHIPSHCEKCNATLHGEDPEPHRHQIWEIPEIKPIIEEHRIHHLPCAQCGHTTSGRLPAGVSKSCFGPTVLAFVAYLTGALRLSKRLTQSVMDQIFDVPVSLGGLSACENQVSQDLAPAVEEAHKFAREQTIAHADETSFRKGNGQKGWLWVMVTPAVAIFMLMGSRCTEAAQRILGSFSGFLCTDRFSAYLFFKGPRQVCWAHLKRDFQAIFEMGGVGQTLGKELLRLTRRMFHWWHRVRDGTMSREEFQRKMKYTRRRVEKLLGKGSRSRSKTLSAKCAKMLESREWFWTFVDFEGVEPTNNLAERTLRFAVIWRKICLGVQSARGAQYVERILTVRATCQLQERDFLEFVRETCAARLKGRPTPSLLPQEILS
jgi:transposase